MRNVKKISEIIHAAFSFGDIRILGVRRVVTFISVTFQHNSLRKSVCCQSNFLDIVRCHRIRVCYSASEVHNDSVVYKVFHILWSIRNIDDVTISNCGILPVDRLVFVHILCDTNFCIWKFTKRVVICSCLCLSAFISRLVIPLSACKAHCVSSAVHDDSQIVFCLWVAEQTCA